LAEGLARLVEAREREVRAETARDIAELIHAEHCSRPTVTQFEAGLIRAGKIADRVADEAEVASCG
jgi:hypothetical protein